MGNAALPFHVDEGMAAVNPDGCGYTINTSIMNKALGMLLW